MAVHRLYIGANNTTREVEIDKVSSLVSHLFKGYTLIEAQGSWEGTKEPNVVVEIQTDEVDKVRSLIAVLKDKLQQQAIGYQVLPDMTFI